MTDVCVSTIYILKPYSSCDGVWRWVIWSWMWIPHDGISDLMRRRKGHSPLFLPCEDTTRRWPSASHEENAHQNLTLLAPWCWTSQPPETWEINFYCLSHPVCGYSVMADQEDTLILAHPEFFIPFYLVHFHSGIISSQPEELPWVSFLVWVCWQQIQLLFIRKCLYFISFLEK